MAHTRKGRDLTERHRVSQAVLSGSIVDLIRALFLSTMRVDDLDGSSQKFIEQAVPLILEHRETSRQVAVDYLEKFRDAELTGLVDDSDLKPDPAQDPHATDVEDLRILRDRNREDYDDLDLDSDLDDLELAREIARDMHSSGAATVKKRIRDTTDTPEESVRKTSLTVAFKAQNKTAAGGRNVLNREVAMGQGAVGYCRVPDADPCPFCAMLASRGAVYRSDAFATANGLFSGDGRFKVHDGCDCTLEPIYGRKVTDLPPQVQELVEEWADIASGQNDPFAHWRRWRTSGTKPGDEQAGSLGTDDTVTVTSARQYGRETRRQKREQSGKSGRKQIADIDSRDELARTLQGMVIRRSGLEAELADLETRGQTVDEPGPAAAIAQQLERLNRQIDHAQKKLVKMDS